jgi:8-hydroxy-5-deazaflavin:NADPH oxidoreductase
MAWGMKIGIIGAGGIGQAVARQLVRAGIPAVISNRRGPESLSALVQAIGGDLTAVTVKEAANEEAVLIAVPWVEVPAAVGGIPDWEGRIVIDATNPILMPGYAIADLGGRPSSEVVAELAPGAQLVKAFNTLPPGLLGADPRQAGGRRVLFYSGDHARAKAEVGRLIEQLGFAGIDLGRLAEGGRLQQFPTGPLPVLDLLRMD